MKDSLSPRRMQPGLPIPASVVNKLSENAVQHVSIPGGAHRKIGNSLCVDQEDRHGGGSILQQFQVATVYDDYLDCHPMVNGTQNTSVTVKVARGPYLRVNDLVGSSYLTNSYVKVDSQTLTVSRTGKTNETWKLWLPYDSDSIITACQPVNGTGLTVGGVAVEWEDVNESGRMWGVASS